MNVPPLPNVACILCQMYIATKQCYKCDNPVCLLCCRSKFVALPDQRYENSKKMAMIKICDDCDKAE